MQASQSASVRSKSYLQTYKKESSVTKHEWSHVEAVSQTLRLSEPAQADECDAVRDNAQSTVYQMSEIPGGVCFDRGRKESLRQKERTLLQQMADVSTDKLVGGLFDDARALQTYISVFVDCVSRATRSYMTLHKLHDKVFMIYKGGNVLTDYFSQFLNISGQEFDEAHVQFLKRSDADFQFYFKDDNLSTVFKQHEDHLKRQVLAAMYKFATWLSHENILPDATFIDATAFSELEERHKGRISIKTATPTERMDFMVLSAAGPLVHEVVVSNKLPAHCDMVILPMHRLVTGIPDSWPSPFGTYITFNDTLKFGFETSRASFDLARMKLNIDVTTSKGCLFHAPAELIDVCFSNPDDYKLAYAKGKSIDAWTQVKQLDGDLTVRIPTLDYLVNHDLHSILFVETGGYPWNDAKYSKRMYRYVMGSALICTSDTAVSPQVSHAGRWSHHGPHLITVMTNLINLLNEAPLATRFTNTNPQGAVATELTTDELAQELRNQSSEVNETFDRATHQFANVLQNIYDVRNLVIKDEDNMNKADERVELFNTMIEHVVKIINVVESQLRRIMITDSGQQSQRPNSRRNTHTHTQANSQRNSRRQN